MDLGLPHEVLVDVLKFVPLNVRLKDCGRVSQAFLKAALAATQVVQLNCREDLAIAASFQEWCRMHAVKIHSLEITSSPANVVQPTSQHLQQLIVLYSHVALRPRAGEPGVLDGCTELTKLCLSNCYLLEDRPSLEALTSVPQLQHFQLCNSYWAGFSDKTTHEWCGLDFPSTLLQQLSRLTHLTLDSELPYVEADSMQHLSCLAALQELSISRAGGLCFSPSTTPGISNSLRSLCLSGRCTLDPTVLFACTGLHHLELDNVKISTAGDPAPLLTLASKLPTLQVLSLVQLDYTWPTPASCSSRVGYTALTASSCLQRMELLDSRLPDGLWSAVFPDGGAMQQLSALTSLVAHPLPELRSIDEGIPMSGADVRQLVRRCPQLQELHVAVPQPEFDLSALQELPHLTKLVLNKVHPVSWRALAGMQGLRALSFVSSVPVQILDVMQLTVLRQLTSLQVSERRVPPGYDTHPDSSDSDDSDELDEFVDEFEYAHLLQDQGPSGPLEVWAQLLQLCISKLQQALRAEQRQRQQVEQRLLGVRREAEDQGRSRDGRPCEKCGHRRWNPYDI